MKRIFIIHGWGFAPRNNFYPWLKSELEKLGYKVFAPDMPDTDTPVIEAWVNHLRDLVGTPDKNTYFIGHSIGCQTILRYLETISTPVGGAIFVAGWFNLTNQDEEEKVIAKPWIETPIDYAKVKVNLTSSVAILSDNDPYVPYEETKRNFEIRLGSEVVTIPGAGHITSGDGFGPFPQLVEIFEKSF